MQRYKIHLFLQNALHVSGGSVEHFAEINEMCNFAASWLYLKVHGDLLTK
jgi:hypothetical protein